MSIKIRKVHQEDAQKLIEYNNRQLEEPNTFLELSKGEYKTTINEELKILERYNHTENLLYIIAEDGEKIIGALHCEGSNFDRTKHNVSLGMTVDKKYRNKGIGFNLLEYAINWAKSSMTIKRIELVVFTTNDRAIHLYKKFGFIVEGEKQKSVRVNREYINEFIMAKQI